MAKLPSAPAGPAMSKRRRPLATVPLCIVVQGAFEKSDSIGFDAVFEYRTLKAISGSDVFLVAEKYDAARYPDVVFTPIADFFADDRFRCATVIYHYCDGWERFDRALKEHSGRAIVRWHNNTPPWFYAADSIRLAERCVRGFESIVELSGLPAIEFWVNSDFTGVQLAALGGNPKRIHTVYPASRYLDLAAKQRADIGFAASGVIRFLFVSRVVAHKGHKHVISLAKYIQENLERKVAIDFAGRADSSAKAFNESLTEAIDDSGVEVNLLGEVDESRLMELYLSADVFVCCSEHEGFGLPAFEAMRCGLPVVAWARTAFEELLAEHPLGIPQFNIPKFAAAVLALEDDAFRKTIVDLQGRIAGTYSREFIELQLRHGLEPSTNPAPVWKLPASKAGGALQTRLRKKVDEQAVILSSGETHPVRFQPREDGHNVVTAYDVAAYRALLNQGENGFDRRVLSSSADRKISSVFLTAADFFSIGGSAGVDGIVVPLGSDTKGHVVFGPYVPCPRGSFTVAFQFQPKSETISGELTVDVHSAESGILARSTVSLSQLQTQPLRLDFVVTKPREILEFRARLATPGHGEILFTGIEVARLNLLSQLIERRDRSLTVRRPVWVKSLMRLWAPDFVERQRPSKTGRKLFKAADALRDREEWASAAETYRQGLKLDPGLSGYVVQMANCLKEAGRLSDAEGAYLAAIAVRVNDPDTWLQLSDLYDRMGNAAGKQAAWQETLRTSRPAIEALKRVLGPSPSHAEIQSVLEASDR